MSRTAVCASCAALTHARLCRTCGAMTTSSPASDGTIAIDLDALSLPTRLCAAFADRRASIGPSAIPEELRYRPDVKFAPASLGHQVVTLGARFFVGLAAAKDGRSITIVDVDVEESAFSREYRELWDLQLELHLDGEARRVACVLGGAFLEYPFDTSCTTVIERALLDHLIDPEGTSLEDSLPAALAPSYRRGTFAVWLSTDGVDYLSGGRDGLICSVAVEEGILDVLITDLQLDSPTFAIKPTFRLRLRDSEGATLMSKEQQIYNARVQPSCFYRSAAELTQPWFGQLAESYRAETARRAGAAYAENGGGLMPHDFMGEHPIFLTVQSWLESGPPPARPTPPTPELDDIERRSGSLEAFDRPVALRLGTEELSNVVGYRIDGYELLVAAAGGALGLFLGHPTSAHVLLLRTDTEPQNRCLYTIDGDAPSMRRLVAWLSAIIERAGLDRVVVPATGDEEENDIYATIAERATALLACGRRRDPYDWRHDSDHICEDAPYWSSNDEYLPSPAEDEIRRVQTEDIPLYYRFWRDVLDPSFRGKLERV